MLRSRSMLLSLRVHFAASRASSKKAITRCSYSFGCASIPPMCFDPGDLPDGFRAARRSVEGVVGGLLGRLTAPAVHLEP
jgi:hypothetical protein